MSRCPSAFGVTTQPSGTISSTLPRSMTTTRGLAPSRPTGRSGPPVARGGKRPSLRFPRALALPARPPLEPAEHRAQLARLHRRTVAEGDHLVRHGRDARARDEDANQV